MPFKMYGKSPMVKKLIGKQHNLPEGLKAKILASPLPDKFSNEFAGITDKQEEQNKITNWHMMKGSDREIYKNKFDKRENLKNENKKPAAPKKYKKGYGA